MPVFFLLGAGACKISMTHYQVRNMLKRKQRSNTRRIESSIEWLSMISRSQEAVERAIRRSLAMKLKNLFRLIAASVTLFLLVCQGLVRVMYPSKIIYPKK